MGTAKSRINISLSDDVKKALINISKRDQMPAATKAVRLMEIGMEVEEDDIWEKIASGRDHKDSTFRSHTEAFGE
jgi:hypothetical protein